MQPHSEVPTTTTTKASATTTTTTTNSVSPKTTTTIKDNKININQSPSLCKLVKGRRPLVNFNFYLDIKDHQISKKVEERITELGGNLEFFLTKSVTHFITDRSLPAAAPPSGSQKAQGSSNYNNNNGNCVNSPSAGVGVNGGGVGGGGGGGGGVYPITPSPYLQSPQTPTTPKTPYTNQTYSGDSATDGVGSSSHHHSRIKGGAASSTNNNNNTPNNKKKISRADAMLHRALQSQQQSQSHYSVNQPEEQQQQQHKRPNLEQGAYRIWSLEYAIRFLKKVTADVKQYAKKSQQPTKGACEPIQLKGHFIKIESISSTNRPYYSVFRNIDWPKIQLGGEGGAFRLTTPKREQSKSAAKDKPSKTNAMTRKSRSSSKHNPNHMRLKAKQAPTKQATEKATAAAAAVDNSSEKQCGVCEICKIEYDTLTIHLKTKDHEFFARNQNNYLALDSLIKSSASVNKFLEDTSKDNQTKEESVEPMEIEEESSRSTRKSSRKQSPLPSAPPTIPTAPPPIKIKTKLKEVVEVVTTVKDKKPSHNGRKSTTKLNVALDSPPIRHPLPTSTIYKVVADNKAQTDPVSPKKSSIIVKFRKIRQTELSILNGEAENFMFPRRPTSSDRATDSDRQTSTDSNRISSSSISSESHLAEEPPVPVPERPDSAAAKRKRTADNSHNKSSNNNTKPAASVCYQSFPNTPIQPNKTSQATTTTTTEHPDNNTKPQHSTTRQRKRHSVGSGERKRRATSRNPRNRKQKRWDSEDRMGEDGNTENDDDDEDEEQVKNLDLNSIASEDSPQKSPKKKKVLKVPAFDVNQGRIQEQTYAFERLPVEELWFEVFRRQDACHERMFEYWGSTSYRKLPYEIGAIPMRTISNCKICTPHQMVEVKQEPVVSKPTAKRVGKLKKIKKERKSKSNTPEPVPASATATVKKSKASKAAPPHNKHLNKATFLSCDLMPRKSPREHASTLAILSCLIKQRKDSEVEELAPPPTPSPKEKTPEKRKTPSPEVFAPPPPPRNDTPEPLQFVSEISENVKRLRRGQRKFDDFVPTTTPLSPNSKKKNNKPGKPKSAGLEYEVDEKRLKSLETKQKSSVQLEHEIDAYLGRISMRALRHTPTLPVHESSSSSSGFVDDFTSDIDLIDLIDCYDGGGGGAADDPNDDYSTNDHSLRRPARSNNVYNLFSAHNRRRKNNRANKTGWPTTRRRNNNNTISTRQNHLLQKPERFRFFCDYQTRQRNSAVQDGRLAPTTTSMTPPDTDLDDKDDCCTRSSVPDEEEEEEEEEEEASIICKDDILANSCMSPSEKADNSDIFTVSSDGLDTDLDISCNQIIKTEDIDDECTTSSTLAAPPPPATSEPAELKIKSQPAKNQLTLAMKNIIKKEVKVSCKRLRTPFRRFRQRR